MGLQFLGLGLIAYLLGSIPFGFLFARLFAKVDNRQIGSGHTGALNTWRAAGWLPAGLTFIGDVGKGLLVIWLARRFGWSAYAVTIAGAMAVVGHCWPVWLRFRGGMGIATAGGVSLTTFPRVLGLAIASWALWAIVFRRSRPAILVTTLLVPLAAWWLGYPPAELALAVAVSILLFIRHI